MKALFGLALTLSKCAAGALDIRAGTAVASLEKRHTRPHVDRLLVVAPEVVVETGQQQLFDTRGAFSLAQRARVRRICAEWLHADVIIGQELTLVNRFSSRVEVRSALQRSLLKVTSRQSYGQS
jgi:hypothetical protein